MSQKWMDILRQRDDADLGQALVRLARQAVALDLAERGATPAETGDARDLLRADRPDRPHAAAEVGPDGVVPDPAAAGGRRSVHMEVNR